MELCAIENQIIVPVQAHFTANVILIVERIIIVQLSTGKLIGGYSTTNWSGSGYTDSMVKTYFPLTNGYKISHCTGQQKVTILTIIISLRPTCGGHDFYIDSNINGGY